LAAKRIDRWLRMEEIQETQDQNFLSP